MGKQCTYFAAVVVMALSTPAVSIPKKVGACEVTTIKSVEQGPGQHIIVVMKNGVASVADTPLMTEEAAIAGARVGDRVRMCVKELPGEGCPKGDDRGTFYRVTDFRTRSTWIARDSLHLCGGA